MPDDQVLQFVDRANLDRANLARANLESAPTDAERALEQTFGCNHRLAVYGTLAPGEPNHHLLAECPGGWTLGSVPGRRAVREFPVFTYVPTAPLVAVHVLASRYLPQHWARLDAFEGPDYRRILVPVFVGGRLREVANLYAARLPVP